MEDQETITIPRELAAHLRAKAQAEGMTMAAYVEQLIRDDGDWGEIVESSIEDRRQESDAIRRAVLEGLEQAERGEGRPARDVLGDLRARYGVSR